MAIDFYALIIYPLLYILPAYVANAAPVIFGGGTPLDLNKRLRGKRIFGDHKTVRGTASGVIAGTLLGLVYIQFQQLGYMLPIAFVLSVGAMAGDLAGSFLKRRAGVKPGASTPVMDQYGFFVVALLLAYPLGHLPSPYGLLFILVLTGILHVLTNRIAHALRLKNVPW